MLFVLLLPNSPRLGAVFVSAIVSEIESEAKMVILGIRSNRHHPRQSRQTRNVSYWSFHRASRSAPCLSRSGSVQTASASERLLPPSSVSQRDQAPADE